MDLFDEVAKVKKDFPRTNSVTDEVSQYKLNFYQIFAIGIFIVFFFLGIVFGNLFATCETSSYFYSDTCMVTQFNYSVMIIIWFISLLISTMVFAVGHIISILSQINEKLNKNCR